MSLAGIEGGKGFNSIVVRLKGDRRLHRGASCIEFQFHSGSIKRWIVLLCCPKRRPFQFHSGSIKRPDTLEGDIQYPRFQFHSGSIKRRLSSRVDVQVQFCFNSIVVRLKVRPDLAFQPC